MIFFMPAWKGNIDLSISTAKSLQKHEPDIPIFFSYEHLPTGQAGHTNKRLKKYGEVFYGGEKGWHLAGKRMFRQMYKLVNEYHGPIIKLDPDAYCLRSGAVAIIEEKLKDHYVVGSTGWGLSLGGVVAMSPDFIEKLYRYPYQQCEDTTRTALLNELKTRPVQIPELVCGYQKERFPAERTCFTHPFVVLRKYYGE